MVEAVGFASDYDGTLELRYGAGVSTQDREAIVRFREQGRRFGVVTGRCAAGLDKKLKGTFDLDFSVLCSGALVLDGHGEAIDQHRISREMTRELVRRFRWNALGLCLVSGYEYWTCFPLSVGRGVPGMFNAVRSLDDIPDPIFGVSYQLPTPRLAARLAERINRTYGESVTAFQNVRSVDVAPAGCSKGTALEVVRAELGITVMGAMGDSFNDVTMLQAADVAYTLPDAPSEVRAVADRCVPNVAAALEDLMGR